MEKYEFELKILKVSCGCWVWLGSTRGSGYAQVSSCHEHTRMADRLALRLYTDTVVPDNKIVMHTCDIPQCVNPEHIRLGTHAENSRDMVVKGRYNHPKGRNYNTEAARAALAERYKDPEFRKSQGVKISAGLRKE